MATIIDATTATIRKADLKAHLETRFCIKVSDISQLGHNVFKVERNDDPSWVARVFDSLTRTLETVEEDAEILRFLEDHSFPAERCALPSPVSITPDGQSVLVSVFVEGRRPRKGEQLFPRLGDLLGRLHTMQVDAAGAISRKGGAWHHICSEGGPKEEIQAALSMLETARNTLQDDQLEMHKKTKSKLESLDIFENLPHAFGHPDLAPSNVITSDSGELVIVDWSGSGFGPRAASLGFLLWAAGHRSMAQVEFVARGYVKHVSLTELELEKMVGAVLFRPLVLRCWEFCMGRCKLEHLVEGFAQMEDLANRIALVANKVFRGSRIAQSPSPVPDHRQI
jgi:Ser/Thr protein kinase RdoA (MazF antagonist)